jgi:hypothetical protein
MAAKKVVKRKTEIATAIPHSWSFRNWPATGHPGDGEAGRRVVRRNLDALLRECAVTRQGRSMIVFGREYDRWLRLQTPRVKAYEVAANRPEHQHKRGGRHHAAE